MEHENRVCDTATGLCVQCVASNDTCMPAQRCDAMTHRCVDGCRADEGCAMNPAGSRCDTSRHACAACVTNDHCAAGTLCVGNVCVAGCNDMRPCPSGQTCCAGGCVDTASNLSHCGACDTRCNLPNAMSACMNGMCAVTSCTGSFADCDMNRSNGCETNTQTDAAHCGMCGVACPARPNARHECNAGFANCDGDAANGCETDLNTASAHCGACGAACTPPNGTGACVTGRCTVGACATGFADCNMNAADGCETDTRINVSNCGACGRSCMARPNAFPGCLASVCVTSCVMGFQDCDGVADNGCEADVRTSGANCGACGRSCTVAHATGVCTAGTCAVASCETGFGDCDMSPANGCEVNLQSDASHCNGCGMRCNLAGATATCAGGRCDIAACNAGRGDCDMNPANGCEVDTQTTVAHCGACGAACNLPNATAACAGGRCAVASCNAGFADCDMNPANGCEVNLSTSTTHCGRCNNLCGFANATATCSAGTCALATCNAGRGNCNMNTADGCETDTQTSATNCGGCGTTCMFANATAACAGGMCALGACTTNFANCNGNAADGCEASLTTVGTAPSDPAARFAPAGSAMDQTPSEDISVEVGPNGEVYVLSYADKIIVFDADGRYLRNYPARGWSTSWSIAVDRATGEMWVVDPNNSTVVRLNSTGNPVTSWNTGLSGPRGVEFYNNEVYVGDYGNNRVAVFTPSGTAVRNFRTGSLLSPRGLTVGRTTGNVYVTSSGNNTLRVYNPAGTELRAWNTCNTPADVAVDECRDVAYVLCEAGDQWIAYRASTGAQLYAVSTGGSISHSGIAVSADGARLYVSHSHYASRATLLFRR
jgi:DNA-binding beta-propeller fold protein YncE